MTFIRLEKLSKAYGDKAIFGDIDLVIARGQICVLVGPSGCGKTTLLRTVAGLTAPDQGRIFIDGEDMTEAPPRRRDIGMVFQQYALFPNLTVEQNLAFALEHHKRPKAEVKRRVGAMMELVGLTEKARARPHVLSGGQKQRVALARALVTEPKLLLLDEPMSALDAQIRKRLREELKRLQKELGFTGLFVTHDQEEALVIGDFNVLEPADIQRVFGRASDCAWAVHPEALGFAEPAPAGAGNGPVANARITAVRLLGSILRYELEADGLSLKLDALNRPDAVPLPEGAMVAVGVAEQNIRKLRS
jgi:putative spermidine/putrescine transport system ATP-binding protein